MTLKISNNRLNKFDARQKLATAIDTASYLTVNVGPMDLTSSGAANFFICKLPKAATYVEGVLHQSGNEGSDGSVTLRKGTNADLATSYTAISAVITLDAAGVALEPVTALTTTAVDCSARDIISLNSTSNVGSNVYTGGSFTFKLVDDPTRS